MRRVNPAYAIAVLSSVVFGTADFLGGIAARRASTLTVTSASGAAGLLSLCVAAIFIRGVALPTLGAGVLDSFANVAYFMAVQSGPLAIVGTIVSLAPAATVLLARIVLRERWTAPQRVGLAFAGAAIACVSLG